MNITQQQSTVFAYLLREHSWCRLIAICKGCSAKDAQRLLEVCIKLPACRLLLLLLPPSDRNV